jgi:hypothetical protein
MNKIESISFQAIFLQNKGSNYDIPDFDLKNLDYLQCKLCVNKTSTLLQGTLKIKNKAKSDTAISQKTKILKLLIIFKFCVRTGKIFYPNLLS